MEKVIDNKIFPKTELERKLRSLLSDIVLTEYGEEYLSDIQIEHPANESFGDFSTNIAMKIAPKTKLNPRDIAQKIVSKWDSEDFEFPEIAGFGFINIKIKKKVLINEILKIVRAQERYGQSNIAKGKKILLEHTSANPNKSMHIGHVRNNVLGNSIANIFKHVGYDVVVDYVVNDRGSSISKVMWGYLYFAKKQSNFVLTDWEKIKESVYEQNMEELFLEWNENPEEWLTPEDFENIKSDEVMEHVYILASKASKELSWVNRQVSKILVDWEREDEVNRKLWKLILNWVFSGQRKTMERLGSKTDHYWYESDYYKEGKELVNKGLEKGVFRRDGDAIITNFEKYNTPDTIVIKSDGTALYITQDLRLTELKVDTFPADKYIWIVGSEQKLTLNQVFLASDLLGIVDKDKLRHFAYGLFTTDSGDKIGSRKGNVISADNLIDLVTDVAKNVIDEKKMDYSENVKSLISEKVGIGALKYFILKANPLSFLKFNVEEATSFDGNTGPYLQYTYARAKSILREAGIEKYEQIREEEIFLTKTSEKGNALIYEKESELSILRMLYKFPEIIINSAENLAPNYIADYVFDLAQKFNTFYRECSVLNAETEVVKKSRLLLTAGVSQVIYNSLKLLGIDALEKM